jgi:hypothetical protein
VKAKVCIALILMSIVGIAAAAGESPAMGKTAVKPAEANVHFDEGGKRLTGIKDPSHLNCVQIECPRDFAKGTACWKCKKAIAQRK